MRLKSDKTLKVKHLTQRQGHCEHSKVVCKLYWFSFDHYSFCSFAWATLVIHCARMKREGCAAMFSVIVRVAPNPDQPASYFWSQDRLEVYLDFFSGEPASWGFIYPFNKHTNIYWALTGKRYWCLDNTSKQGHDKINNFWRVTGVIN